MVKQLENGIKVVSLGEKTTSINHLIPSESNSACGILFSSQGKEVNHTNSVIIEFTNEEGIFSYIEALVELLKILDTNRKTNNVIQLKDYLKEIV